MDETPCQVLREKGKTPQSKSYMWLYCTGNDGLPPIAMYEYQSSSHGEHAKEFLKEFKGKYAVCDGYQGYNKLSDNITRCGCLAHVRRKWADTIHASDGSRLGKAINLPTALKPVRSYIAWWKVQKGTSLMS